VHVSLANFIDTMIDYPRSKEYAFEMFDRLEGMNILTREQLAKYKLHVQNLENYDSVIIDDEENENDGSSEGKTSLKGEVEVADMKK
jgi:hypothetical protein